MNPAKSPELQIVIQQATNKFFPNDFIPKTSMSQQRSRIHPKCFQEWSIYTNSKLKYLEKNIKTGSQISPTILHK